MSTEIGTIHNAGSRNVDVQVTRYWGGDKNGVCYQLTADMGEHLHHNTGLIQLKYDEILGLLKIIHNSMINK